MAGHAGIRAQLVGYSFPYCEIGGLCPIPGHCPDLRHPPRAGKRPVKYRRWSKLVSKVAYGLLLDAGFSSRNLGEVFLFRVAIQFPPGQKFNFHIKCTTFKVSTKGLNI